MIIKNTKFLLPGFAAFNFMGIIFKRPNVEVTPRLISHELIHTRQLVEVTIALLPIMILISALTSWWVLLLAPFTYYIWYGLEYSIRFLCTFNQNKAYHGMLFEVEAYEYQHIDAMDIRYPKRKHFRFLKYLFKK